MLFDSWKKQYTADTLSKSPEFAELLQLHNLVINATFLFFLEQKIPHANVPITTSLASSPMSPGSDSAPVKVKIHDKSVLLTDSAQFYLEYACRAIGKGCYYYGHSFRDETPDTRHLSQFSHVEAELPCDLNGIKAFVEKYIKFITKYIFSEAHRELTAYPGMEARVSDLLGKDCFASVPYTEAVSCLSAYPDALRFSDGRAYITPAGEHYLLQKFGDFTWIENWDRMTVPFYQAVDDKTGLAINADLLCGIGETVGAGQRHTDAKALIRSLDEQNIDKAQYEWYINMKQSSPLLTSGYGMGVERYLLWLLNLHDIRSVELFEHDRYQRGIL